jgi:hypothetical protein
VHGDARAPGLPPRRELDAEAGLGEDWRSFAQEGVRAGEVEVEPGRVCLAEHPVQWWVESCRAAQVGEHPLLRVVEPAAEHG